MLCCIGCRWQGFGSGKSAAARHIMERTLWQETGADLCQTWPVPTDPPQGSQPCWWHLRENLFKKEQKHHTGRRRRKTILWTPRSVKEVLKVPEQRFPCSPGEDHAGTDTHNAVLLRTLSQSRWISPEGPASHGKPRLRQLFPEGLQLTERLTPEQGESVKKQQQREIAMSWLQTPASLGCLRRERGVKCEGVKLNFRRG